MNYINTPTIISSQIAISNYLYPDGLQEVIAEITGGLSSEKKHIPSKYFYDARGSKLFEDITHLAEYYPTRT